MIGDNAFFALLGVFAGIFLSFFVARWVGSLVHHGNAGYRACKDRGGALVRTSDDSMVFCGDGTRWRWREGYIVEVKP